MRSLRIGIIDLTTNCSNPGWWDRIRLPSYASVMSQSIGVWCEELGHRVSYVCYTGIENLFDEISTDIQLLFIGAFTQSAQMAYALSNYFQKRGAVTVLGGPHARSYPQDSQMYFDYVLGFTDKILIQNVLTDCQVYRPIGVHLTAMNQPISLPSVRERWKFIEPTLKKASLIKCVPMLASLGCPYTCNFCIDADVAYQALEVNDIKEDLRFLLGKFKRPLVGWHDPNFGVRFDEIMDALEDTVPPDSIDCICESSLSILSESHLKRLKRNGFKAILPGVESWFEMGDKSKTGKKTGMEKVEQVSEHVNTILKYIPWVQTNFVLGLDSDHGSEPFELTKRFVERTPGAYPGFMLLTAHGQAAPLNLEFQKNDRVLNVPFHLLDNTHAMNVTPKNYSWKSFYNNVIDLYHFSLSMNAIIRRFRAIDVPFPRWHHVMRTLSSEGLGLFRHHRKMLHLINTNSQFRDYLEKETTKIPSFMIDKVQRDLGPMWEWLPPGALYHDTHAYLKSVQESSQTNLELISKP